jgi:hypothetical protein
MRVTLTVVRKSPAVLELLSSEDQSLLVGRDALLVLDLGLDVVDRVRGLDLERDRLSGEAEVSGERGGSGGKRSSYTAGDGRIGCTHVLTKICMLSRGVEGV